MFRNIPLPFLTTLGMTRGGLAPEFSEDEIIISPMLEKMGIFEFKKYR